MNYFINTKRVDLNSLLSDADKVHAHVMDGKPPETLEEHSNRCIGYLHKIIDRKQLENVFINLENRLLEKVGEESRQLYRDMLYHTIYFHDIGKINFNFQRIKMKNKFYSEIYDDDCNNSNHSMLSALIYINEFFRRIGNINDADERNLLFLFLLLNAYMISKHHGNLDCFELFTRKLTESDGEGTLLYTEQTELFQRNYPEKILGVGPNKRMIKIVELADKGKKFLCEEKDEVSIALYIYERFVISLLLACDYYATTEFKNQKEVDDFGEIQDIEAFYKIFKASPIYQNIRSYETKVYYQTGKSYDAVKDMNIFRNELFLDAEKMLLRNLACTIFYLEAPTGAGKSMVSFNLAFKLVEQAPAINKIFYVYPFNTLIEQNMESLSKIFGNSDQMKNIAVINSLVPIKTMPKVKNSQEDSDVINTENIDYTKSLLDRQFLHYPFILTTHVSMFRFLFGTGKEDLFPLSQIVNSVIIFDEIQSYKNSIWKEIITFLNQYAQLLNIKVIIMSATLPNLSKLVGTEIDAVNLIEDKNKFFQHPIFKNRVKADFSLLDITNDVMYHVIKHAAKCSEKDNINLLMEFIYRSSADEAYARFCNMEIKNKDIMLLTGESSAYERKQIVKAFKERKNILLVATQVVEAGIDLDADFGYKDISLLDSEEQFLGRVNRHFSDAEKIGIVYFFNLDSAEALYRGDVRKEPAHTLVDEKIRTLFVNKDFDVYYERILAYLLKRVNSADGFNEFMNNDVNPLNFKSIAERMNLIDEQYQYSIFLSRDLWISDSEMLHGEEVWNNYVGLLEDTKMDYAEKRIKLQEASIQLNYFIYKTRKNDFPYEKHIGDLYYLSDVDQYFEDGRFVRKNFDNDLFT
ncbi:CRISPR-associated helicase Cas3' [Clostridium aminobutyricum]|uniref:CRISPR-associated helicase Cas3' n=1 Tax=Clostridium aminobutyricum TaxID=33953 RepID=UPI0031451425